MPNPIVDPRDEPYALAGRIVTMNANADVLESGRIYVNEGKIVAVQPGSQPAPTGFENAPVIDTGGTIFPGLIELHNHLSYNILPLWNVPETFESRSQWRSNAEKRRLVTAPMFVLGHTPTYTEAVIRYVECKCLVAGVTTSQGISLTGIAVSKFYRGIVRNVEAPLDANLPVADTKIADVSDVEKFWAQLQRAEKKVKGAFLLHLCEGINAEALRHFDALRRANGEWAINSSLVGIHSTALRSDQFALLAQAKGAIVWSPLSNLLLYAETTDIGAALESGVTIGLGSDWSPTGSKNLLCELKVAQIVAAEKQLNLTPRQLVAMATIDAARILKWQDTLGSIETGKQADFVVIQNGGHDPYQALIDATEREIRLVVIRGIPRYGITALMQPFGGETEPVEIGGEERLLNLWDEVADPAVSGLSLAEATARLQDGLSNLPSLAKALADAGGVIARLAASGQVFNSITEAAHELGMSVNDLSLGIDNDELSSGKPPIFLDLEEDEFDGFGAVDSSGGLTASGLTLSELAENYAELLQSTTIALDPLTVVDDANYFQTLLQEMNLPNYVKQELPARYGVTPTLPADVHFLANQLVSRQIPFMGVTDLATFLNQPGFLSLSDRQLLIQEALRLLERVYVHLPMKRSMYAIDPLQRLRLLMFELEDRAQDNNSVLAPEMAFHRQMISIFTSLRDLHTSYSLPFPYRGKAAFLPFLIEEYFDDECQPHYIVSKVAGDLGDETFKPNVEVLYWNGVPIQRAIEQNAERHAGSNRAASLARGIDSLTIRPLTYSLPPDEEWVTLRYRTEDGEIRELTQKWLVFPTSQIKKLFSSTGSNSGVATAFGMDHYTDTIQQVKLSLFKPEIVEAAERAVNSGEAQPVVGSTIETKMPGVFRPLAVNGYGYIRIFTFNVDDADAFVDEFVNLVKQLPSEGLIIDVRGNGGGLIYAAERLLQVLTPHRPIEPSRAQFINSSLILQLCKRHAPSPVFTDFDLRPWIESVRQAIRTGATYSQAIPITDPKTCNNREPAYSGPIVLIVDGLCYSATDIFVAGFQDHDIGTIIGTSDNTGAGGANVWGYNLLQMLMNDSESEEHNFKALPHGADMRVAIRRTLRVGEQAGTPLEDLGIRPDRRYYMKQVDLLESNRALIDYACDVLKELSLKGMEVA